MHTAPVVYLTGPIETPYKYLTGHGILSHTSALSIVRHCDDGDEHNDDDNDDNNDDNGISLYHTFTNAIIINRLTSSSSAAIIITTSQANKINI